MSKHKVLGEKVLVKTDDGRIIPTTAVLSVVSGGKAVNYIDEQGFIVKTEVYSRSPYYLDKGSITNLKGEYNNEDNRRYMEKR